MNAARPLLTAALLFAFSPTVLAAKGGKDKPADDTPHYLFSGGADGSCLDCHEADVTPSGGVFSAASTAADWFSNQCRTCHASSTAASDLHHTMMVDMGMECLDCHTLTWDYDLNAYFLTRDQTFCFAECHTPMFYRETDGYLYQVTNQLIEQRGWSIESNATTKMADEHHANYGAPADDCNRCHTMEWNPDTSGYDVVYVEGSAGDGQDVENIIIDVWEGVVHDIEPGDTLTLHASAAEGSVDTIHWSISNQYITDGDTLRYKFRWAEVGDTYVVKLEMWSTDSRYHWKNIVVNVR